MSAELDLGIGGAPPVHPAPGAAGARPAASSPSAPSPLDQAAGTGHGNGSPHPEAGTRPGAPYPASGACTSAQLRRFIKSRAYVPMHELRRRFELNGEADDVSHVGTQSGTVFLGLPLREAHLIGELVRQGEVGLELCRDPRVPIVVGVFPIRPITRQ